MKFREFAAFTMLICLFCLSLTANDGSDRYHPDRAVVLQHLYAPVTNTEGYTVLEEDMAGGADGAPAFRWARPFTLAIIRLAAWDTANEFGVSPIPMALFDMTTEFADTPVSREEGKPPRGRHPGNSHDGGINIDLGYYMTSLKGLYEEPDFSVCDEHYSETAKDEDGKPKDAYECLGPANRLDEKRQAYFFLQLFKMHIDLFDYMLFESIGVDYHVKKAVLEQIRKWQSESRYCINDQIIREMDTIMTCARWEGWAKFHHHHTHIRFHDLDSSGEFRRVFEKLYEQERAMELAVQKELNPEKAVFIKADLYSYSLTRYIEASLLSEDPSRIKKAEYSLDEGEWISSEEPDNNFRCMLDVQKRIPSPERKLILRARYETADGNSEEIVREIYSPAVDAQARIRIDRNKFRTFCEKKEEGGSSVWECRLEYPQYYNYYITDLKYVFYIREFPEKPENVEADRTDNSCRFVQKEGNTVEMIEAVITLTARMRISVPVYINIE